MIALDSRQKWKFIRGRLYSEPRNTGLKENTKGPLGEGVYCNRGISQCFLFTTKYLYKILQVRFRTPILPTPRQLHGAVIVRQARFQASISIPKIPLLPFRPFTAPLLEILD